jgi:hypothetical protein
MSVAQADPDKYRSRDNPIEEKLYQQLIVILKEFTTPERLAECLHEWDSQMNEAMNRAVSARSPKDRTYGRTMSLSSRVHVAAGTVSAGMNEYYGRVMKEIGIELTPVQSTLFKRLDKRKGKKRLREKDPKTKRRRALKGCLKIAAENKKTIKSMKKNMGYRTGVNMEPDVDPGEGAKQPAAKRRKSQKDLVCKDCKEQGHGTKRSRACRFNATENPLHVLQNLDLNDGKSRRR